MHEVLNRKIAVAPMRADCNIYPDPNKSPSCPITYGAAQLDIQWIPSDWQCPCPANGYIL